VSCPEKQGCSLYRDDRTIRVVNKEKQGLLHSVRKEDNTNGRKLCVKVKVQFTLEQTTKAQRWSRGIAVLFL
jgi:hypothetical protein